jgi:uncharacterized protein YyaL (SSP411 family)
MNETDPTRRNRLDEAASPYLRQHADNPVHWQPWDETALEAARERDVPIFLSIGYSACHWCHVMAEESFEDPAVADLLNESFVPIKVDREERPDVDAVYMEVCQLVTGGGGWPLSAWLTPEGEPFYVGTYFPTESPPNRNVPGFRDLLERIASSWADPDQRREMESRADQWTAALTDRLESTPGPDERGTAPGVGIVDEAAAGALRSVDDEFGGFGRSGPKFPTPTRLEVLLSSYARSGREAAFEAAVGALDAMADGGMYDHLGGGFHRYATDRKWRVPHFEKMLYDNAELVRLYADAHRLTGTDRYAEVVRDTVAFVDRELRHPDGGYRASLDARSDGEEGTFYVWTPDQVAAAVDDDRAAAVFCDRYGVTDRGNFEGSTVLHYAAPVADVAADHDLSVDETRDLLATAEERAFAAREERRRPARDDKVLAGWNGLAISGLANAAVAFPDDGVDYAGRARDALEFVRDRLWTAGDGDAPVRLARHAIDGDVVGRGYLEDYAYLARGAVDLYGATGDVDALGDALALARSIVTDFYDADRGTLYSTPAGGEALVARPQERADQSTPSSLGVAARVLARLDGFAPDDFGAVVDDVLATHANEVRASPVEHGSLALAAAERAGATLEVTIAADDLPAAWRATLAETYLPGAVVARRPPTETGLADWLDRLGVDEAPPVWAGREARDGPTAYACENFTCSPPLSDLSEALSWFDGARDEGDAPGPGLDDVDELD